MTTIKQLREWLDSLPGDASVGIDDGGLTLEAQWSPGGVGQCATYEVGGLPEPLDCDEWPDDEDDDDRGYSDLDKHDAPREAEL